MIERWQTSRLSAMMKVRRGVNLSLSHYRDNRKREIDFIVERKDGALLGVEVKAGQASTGDFRHLKWFAGNIAKTPFIGIVLYSGNKTLRFGDGFYAVPLAALGA